MENMRNCIKYKQKGTDKSMKNESLYTVGKMVPTWKPDSSQTITFVVTEDCNLRCKYCYITHKSSNKVISFDIAKKFIDFIFKGEINHQDAVILEFIGGEPLIEVGLIDKIVDYFRLKAFELNHPWFWNYRISICTNGINYNSTEVQKFIRKNYTKLSLSISIDGTKTKHDLQRVFPNGEGSYDKIMEILPLYLSQFRGATKITFASQDLIYLKDSIITLWDKGITDVSANVVFENVWKKGDDEILEKQLMELADYVLDNKLFNKFYCSFFDDSIGYYYNNDSFNRTYCGAGKMLSIGPNGNLYPCIRYKDYSLNNKEEWVFGNIDSGINMERVRPFMLATIDLQSDDECLRCPIAAGCAFCQGFNYDEAETSTNFTRAKYICKMHKARVRANDYYFSRLFNCYGIEKEENKDNVRNDLIILLSDDYVTYCEYNNECNDFTFIDDNVILNSLKYARNTFAQPIMIHSKSKFNFKYIKEYDDYRIKHIMPINFMSQSKEVNIKDCVYVVEPNDISQLKDIYVNECILNIDCSNLDLLANCVIELYKHTDKINLNLHSLNSKFSEENYIKELNKIKDYLILYEGKNKSLNLIDDLLLSKQHKKCKAGSRSFTVSPKGELFICPAFYSSKCESIGNLDEGITNFKGNQLFSQNYQPLCKICDAYQCSICYFTNKLHTNEVNVPPSFKCRKSHCERQMVKEYADALNIENDLNTIDYKDPMKHWMTTHDAKYGYYKSE